MGRSSSQALLDLENRDKNSSSKESALLVCKNGDDDLWKKLEAAKTKANAPPDTKPIIAAPPPSQDVIGAVIPTNDSLKVHIVNGTRRFKIHICNLEGEEMQVTLWAKLVDQLSSYIQQNPNKTHVVIVLQFAKKNEFLVMGKLKDFLGVMAESNKKLQQDSMNSNKYDIEVFTGNESGYIEMDLMLGVADLHTPEAVAAAESAILGSQPVISIDDSSTESESESESESETESESEVGSDDESNKSKSKSKKGISENGQKRKRPNIVELQ